MKAPSSRESAFSGEVAMRSAELLSKMFWPLKQWWIRRADKMIVCSTWLRKRKCRSRQLTVPGVIQIPQRPHCKPLCRSKISSMQVRFPSERSKADADATAAEERLAATTAQREKCFIRSPIDGTITRVNMRIGEAFSTVVPCPIITVADLSERRIRAEVDERDLSEIHVDQRVRISAEGLHQPFGGRSCGHPSSWGEKPQEVPTRPTDPIATSWRHLSSQIAARRRYRLDYGWWWSSLGIDIDRSQRFPALP